MANACETPSCNTGLNSQNSLPVPGDSITVRPDWLQVITSHPDKASFALMLQFLEQHFLDKIDFAWDRPRVAGRQWDASGRSVRGLQVAARPLESGGYQGWVCIPGSCWDGQNLMTSWECCQRLRFSWDGRATRFDIALDDFSRSLDFDDICDAAESGNYAWAGRHQIYLSGKRSSPTVGRSVVFGSASSDKRFTIYDKAVESGGEINSIRCEARLRDVRANFVFEHFTNIVPYTDEYPSLEIFLQKSYDWLCECLFGCVNFVQRVSKNLSRCPVLPWWSAFVERCRASAPKRLQPEKIKPSFQKTVNWLFNQVSSALALYASVFGRSSIDALLDVGKRNFSAWHDAQLAVFIRDS